MKFFEKERINEVLIRTGPLLLSEKKNNFDTNFIKHYIELKNKKILKKFTTSDSVYKHDSFALNDVIHLFFVEFVLTF